MNQFTHDIKMTWNTNIFIETYVKVLTNHDNLKNALILNNISLLNQFIVRNMINQSFLLQCDIWVNLKCIRFFVRVIEICWQVRSFIVFLQKFKIPMDSYKFISHLHTRHISLNIRLKSIRDTFQRRSYFL